MLDRCSGATCSPPPGLRLYVRSRGRPVGSCVRTDLRVKVGGSERENVLSADFIVGRRRVGRVLEAPAIKDIPRARLRSTRCCA